jgi:rhamnulokinase
VAAVEQSMASTTQVYDPRREAWSPVLIEKCGMPAKLFPRIVPSGTVLGPIIGALAELPALAETKVVATCSHDTGAAVAAVPAGGGHWAYLSSGTWSLLGAELDKPQMGEKALAAGFTNEVGLGGSIRFLKNIAGLWVVQECRRAWEAAGRTYDYDQLTQMAVEAGPALARISIRDPRFLTAGGMPEKIAALCRETAQPVPATPGQTIRLVLESLATCYGETLRQLEEVTGRKFGTIHIVGGGCRNDLLNQLTADATGCTIVAGPVEATAIGNVLIQALALGHLKSAAHLREVVEASFPTRLFHPSAPPSS